MRTSAISTQHSALSQPVWSGHSCPLPLTLKLLLIFILTMVSSLAFTQDKPIALKGGKILTVTKGVIENGVIVMQGGKITAVGAGTINIPSKRTSH